jgi:hypothetical protein
MAELARVRELSKREVLNGLWHHGVIDLSVVNKDAETLGKLKEALSLVRDGGSNPITRTVQKLLIVDSLIDLETDCGNEDCSGNLARGIGEILHRCAADLNRVLSRAAADDTAHVG